MQLVEGGDGPGRSILSMTPPKPAPADCMAKGLVSTVWLAVTPEVTPRHLRQRKWKKLKGNASHAIRTAKLWRRAFALAASFINPRQGPKGEVSRPVTPHPSSGSWRGPGAPRAPTSPIS